MEVPFFDYKKHYLEDKNNFDKIFSDVCTKGAFIMQSELVEFENNLSKFLGCKHVIGVADGTLALIFSLKASGIKPGDEVILSSHTFIATAAAISDLGGKPVVADCLEDSTIDPDSVEKLISKKTKAIMPTQLNGRVSNMDELIRLSKQYNLEIIEDSCQALGAKYKGKPAGLFGLCGSYSFFPAKTLGSFGDGGAIATNCDRTMAYIKKLRNHGRDDDGYVEEYGNNGRLDNIQAAFLNYKLNSYSKNIYRRREIAKIYNDELSCINEIKLPPPPVENQANFDIYQNYEVQIASDKRKELMSFLKSNNIGTIIQWNGWMIHQFSKLELRHDCEYAENFSKRMLLLPMNHYLDNDQVLFVCKKIKTFFKDFK